MKYSEANKAGQDLKAAGAQLYGMAVRPTKDGRWPAGSTQPIPSDDVELTLIIVVKGPRGGRQTREYTSYAALVRAIPTICGHNTTKVRRHYS